MNKEELEAFWTHTLELNKNVNLNASTMDDVYDSINRYARENGIDPDELDIEY